MLLKIFLPCKFTIARCELHHTRNSLSSLVLPKLFLQVALLSLDVLRTLQFLLLEAIPKNLLLGFQFRSSIQFNK